jgi:two-component system cell cycle response regulator
MEQGAEKSKAAIPILVAEDHPATRGLLEKLLKKAGYQVTTARSGREALERFQSSFFPIVLIDWIMPEMDGLELCGSLRNLQNEGYVYIVFLTSRDSKDDVVKALDTGADDYVTKPFNQNELLARIRTGQRILELERSLKTAYKEIKMLSLIDPLTGVYNRGYLNDHISQEIMRSLRYGHPLHIALCDIDHFKNVNDRHGHQAGDEVLRSFADLMKDSIRQKVDWVARYGGEEFVVVLPETDASGAQAVAERLRRAVARKRHRIQGKVVRITASLGVSGFDPDQLGGTFTADSLLNEADKCLLKAKQEGRNRVRTSWIEKGRATYRRKLANA